MRQWMLRITAYAERLIDELDGLDWPESIKLLQKNWIGKSEGAEVHFPIVGVAAEGADSAHGSGSVAARRGTSSSDGRTGRAYQQAITVFTTRPDTLYGATYMVLAPEHSLVESIVTEEQWPAVREYRRPTGWKRQVLADLNSQTASSFNSLT